MENSPSPYQPDTYLKPGANLQVLVWLVLLGLPALVLFLVFSKLEAPSAAPASQAPVVIEQATGQ